MVLAYTWSKNLESVAFLNNQDPTTTKVHHFERPAASRCTERRL